MGRWGCSVRVAMGLWVRRKSARSGVHALRGLLAIYFQISIDLLGEQRVSLDARAGHGYDEVGGLLGSCHEGDEASFAMSEKTHRLKPPCFAQPVETCFGVLVEVARRVSLERTGRLTHASVVVAQRGDTIAC